MKKEGPHTYPAQDPYLPTALGASHVRGQGSGGYSWPRITLFHINSWSLNQWSTNRFCTSSYLNVDKVYIKYI